MTPAHHYPTGVVMTAERRGALIAWARERGALIVEDDYDVEYRFGRDPVASLQGLAPDLVAFVGTTSKTLAPALRLAWVVPPSHLIDDVENVLLVTGVTPPTLDQIAMASFIEDAALEVTCVPCAAVTARSETSWWPRRSASPRDPALPGVIGRYSAEPPVARRMRSVSRSMSVCVPPALPNSCW
jgi:hypothetical protein